VVNAQKAVAELGIQAEVVKVEDLMEIASRGVMMTPAVVIDGQIKAVGKVPTVAEIKKWLQ
jgi:small redox-active disulfide protein 2